MRRLFVALGLSVCLLSLDRLFATESDRAAVDPSRFEVTALVAGLKQPMELALAPDGTVFLIELDGKVKSVHPKTREVAVVGDLKVTTAQENGLIGLTLDPKFAENSWFYLQYSPPDFPGQHISRFTLVDGKLDPASEKVLLKFEEQPDGKLLARVPVEVNGQRKKFYERTADLPETNGRHDLIVRFVHPTKAGGLKNLDSIHF